MPNESRFWDRAAARYAARPISDEAAHREKLARARAHLAPGMRVIDIGCGTGTAAIAQAPHVAHVRAIDISGEMIRIARERAAAAGVANVSFERGALEEIDPAEGPWDAAFALSFLHLAPDRNAALARIAALLAPRGVLVANSFCLADMQLHLRLIVAGGRRLGLLPHVRAFSRAGLRASLAGAGFELLEERLFGRALFQIAHKTG
jgi:ubiquinone/menaquinone biosynthesis C-methylase UbiE